MGSLSGISMISVDLDSSSFSQLSLLDSTPVLIDVVEDRHVDADADRDLVDDENVNGVADNTRLSTSDSCIRHTSV
jgi:hypothetical protein